VKQGASRKTSRRKRAVAVCCLLHGGFLIALLFNMKREAICSSETVDFARLHVVMFHRI
jgi:hypothetical protein